MKTAKAVREKPRPRVGTRERIIETSIRLFNRGGVQNVAIESIAADMGTSPGTLTYHFRRKDELMHAILVQLELRMREALAPPKIAQVPEYGAAYLKNILRTFWDFRFFFNALTYLLSKDRKLRKAYFSFQDWAIDTLDKGLEEMVRTGSMMAVRSPNTTRLLAGNIWTQWLSWLRMQQIESPTATMPDGEAFYACALHHWSLLEPYFAPDFAKGLLPLYGELFLSASDLRKRRRKSSAAIPLVTAIEVER